MLLVHPRNLRPSVLELLALINLQPGTVLEFKLRDGAKRDLPEPQER